MNTTANTFSTARPQAQSTGLPPGHHWPDSEFVTYEMMRMGRTIEAQIGYNMGPSGYGASWPDYPQSKWTAYETDGARTRAVPPKSFQIDHADFWNGCLKYIRPKVSPFTKKVIVSEREAVKIKHCVRLRSLIDPLVTDDPKFCDKSKKMHCFTWEDIADSRMIRSDRNRAKGFYDYGIDMIVAGLKAECWSHEELIAKFRF